MHVSIYIVSDTDNTLSNKVRKAILSILSVLFHDFNDFALLKNDLAPSCIEK